MEVPINVKSPNISKWQMGFNSVFKGLTVISDSWECDKLSMMGKNS
jgi:hypothetical protein